MQLIFYVGCILCISAEHINSKFSFSVFLDVSLYIIISSAVRDNFNSFLPTYLFFNYFYCLTALARTFYTILNENYKSEYLCFGSDLEGK